MALNTYPYSPFPASTEQIHKGDNEDLQEQINAIKDGTNIDSFGDVETALEDKTDTAVIAPAFDAESGVYAVGDLVMYQGKLYEFTTAHETAGDWDSTEVAEKTVSDEIDTVKSGLTNLQKSKYGNGVDIRSYNTSDNRYTFGADGYLVGYTGTDVIEVVISGAEGSASSSITALLNIGSTVYVRNGMRCYIKTNAGNNLAFFIPMV